jgi:hypothetical protein
VWRACFGRSFGLFEWRAEVGVGSLSWGDGRKGS